MTKKKKQPTPSDLTYWVDATELPYKTFKEALYDQTDAVLTEIGSLLREFKASHSTRNKLETRSEQERRARKVSMKYKAAMEASELPPVNVEAYYVLKESGHNFDDDMEAMKRLAAAYEFAATASAQRKAAAKQTKRATKPTYTARDQLVMGVVRVLDKHVCLTQTVKGVLVGSVLETIGAPCPSGDMPRLLRRIAKQQPKIG